jgi:signal transduction histidine kinase
MPEARLAQVVQLADLTARQCGIGQSGSFDSANSSGQILRSLGIAPKQMEEIRQRLGEEVAEKCRIAGMDSAQPQAEYLEVLHKTAAQLTKRQTNLTDENQRLQTAASHLNFITDFLSDVNSADSPIDIAEDFAVRWQKFYQTGMVCLYLAPSENAEIIDAVIVEKLSQSKVVSLKRLEDEPVIPQALTRNFGILNAYEHIAWLFDQLDVDFDVRQTKLMPLRSGGKAVGAIAFELRYPSDVELFIENFKMATSVAGLVLDLATAGHNQEQFAERFVQLISPPKAAAQQPVQGYSLNTLAEMAGGAAHELNNPLAVISGRAQLLAQAESDAEKKRMLKQIQENAGEITKIVDDLMAFANPPQPRPTRTNVKQMLDEAVQLAAMKENLEQIDVQIETDDAEDVYVDSAQIASAIANVICNSAESYPDKAGLTKITGEPDESGNFVKLQITDFGCGMDGETLRKATQPFFSSQQAGRKRGMGLAHTNRLVQLNQGSLHITSQPGNGTTVTILLPVRS